MNLDDAQKKKVTEWIAQGLKLSEIQKRLSDELGLSLTYMEARLLVDDLKLMPKDTERPKPVELSGKPAEQGANAPAAGLEPGEETGGALSEEALPKAGTGNVKVSVDQIARAGAVASGNVTFSDGNSAAWYLDQFGRLGLAPKKQGYKPPANDLQAFQMELQNELAKMGF
jgi:hypothetical protein